MVEIAEMSSGLRSVCSVLVLVMIVGMLSSDGRHFVVAESSYRKPPFNGSIFGKRAPPMNSLVNSNRNNNNGKLK